MNEVTVERKNARYTKVLRGFFRSITVFCLVTTSDKYGHVTPEIQLQCLGSNLLYVIIAKRCFFAAKEWLTLIRRLIIFLFFQLYPNRNW